MRQSSDIAYSTLLSRVRNGEITRSDIELLMTRIIPDDHEDFVGALRVFPTVREVLEYNEHMQLHLNQHCIQHTARHQFQSADSGNDNVTDEYIPSDDRDAGGLPRRLLLSVGTRVMLTRNIATENGLVNGALGFVKAFTFEDNQLIRVFVQFDDEAIGRIFYDNEHDAIYVEPITQEFHYHGRSVYRTQFPLLPAWASTIHKVQGISVDKIVVSLGKSVFAEGQFYVALSRVRTLKGLGILALNVTRIKANKDVVSFYKQLRVVCKHEHN